MRTSSVKLRTKLFLVIEKIKPGKVTEEIYSWQGVEECFQDIKVWEVRGLFYSAVAFRETCLKLKQTWDNKKVLKLSLSAKRCMWHQKGKQILKVVLVMLVQRALIETFMKCWNYFNCCKIVGDKRRTTLRISLFSLLSWLINLKAQEKSFQMKLKDSIMHL